MRSDVDEGRDEDPEEESDMKSPSDSDSCNHTLSSHSRRTMGNAFLDSVHDNRTPPQLTLHGTRKYCYLLKMIYLISDYSDLHFSWFGNTNTTRA